MAITINRTRVDRLGKESRFFSAADALLILVPEAYHTTVHLRILNGLQNGELDLKTTAAALRLHIAAGCKEIFDIMCKNDEP